MSVALKNINWLLLEKLIGLPIGLATSIILARHLGPDAFGSYNFLLSLVYLVTPFSAMGLNAIITRELVNAPEREGAILGASFLGRLVGSCIGLGCLMLYAVLTESESRSLVFVLAVFQMCSTLTLIDFWFQAKKVVRYSAFSRLLASFFVFTSRLAAVYAEASLEVFVWIAGIEYLLIALAYLTFYMRQSGRINHWVFSVSHMWQMLKQSYWLILSGIAAAIYLRIDIVMLEHFTTSSEVGVYAVASRLSEIWYFIPGAVVSALFPALLQAKQESESIYMDKLQRLSDVLFGLAVAVVIPVLFLARFVIELLYGEAYVGASHILQVHIFAGVFIFMRALLSKWLIAEHLLKFSLLTQGLGALSNVFLNLVLIPEYGGLGAAWATLISYMIASYAALALSSKTRPYLGIMSRSMISPVVRLRDIVLHRN